MAPQTLLLEIHPPLGREDLPGLYARACAALTETRPEVLLLGVAGVPADAVAVDAVARLALAARRHRCSVRLRGAPPELLDLIELIGVGDVLAG